MKIILGSSSPHRKRILREMGYEFEVLSADIDEKAIRHSDPAQLTLILAHAKADAIIPRITKPALLITCDQVVWCNGEILEKPADAAEVHRYFKTYEAYPAETVCAVVVTNTQTGKRVDGVDVAKVIFSPVPKEVIEALILNGKIFTCAGGFSCEDDILNPYIKEIQGTRESVEGLPPDLTRELLNKAKL